MGRGGRQWEGNGRQWKAGEKARGSKERSWEAVGGSEKGSGRQLLVAKQESWTPAPAPLVPGSPQQPVPRPARRPLLVPPSWLPPLPPRQSPTHSKPPGPRRPPAAAAGAGWLPAAVWGRAIAGSSALQERSTRRHHPVVPLPPPCAGASPRQRLLPGSHLGWALLSPAPPARSRRDCHPHRGRWMWGPRQTSGRHRPRSGPCPGRPRWPCGLCSP